MPDGETEVGPDGNVYAVCRCRKCGEKCLPMSAAYQLDELCLRCYNDRMKD